MSRVNSLEEKTRRISYQRLVNLKQQILKAKHEHESALKIFQDSCEHNYIIRSIFKTDLFGAENVILCKDCGKIIFENKIDDFNKMLTIAQESKNYIMVEYEEFIKIQNSLEWI